MGIREKLQEDLKQALKNKDTLVKDTIRYAISMIKKYEIDNKVELSDNGIIPILQKYVKQQKDAIFHYKKASRDDLVEKAQKEIEILSRYIPAALSKEELLKIIDEAIENTGAVSQKDFGRVMREVMPRVKGRAEGSEVNQMVRERLGG